MWRPVYPGRAADQAVAACRAHPLTEQIGCQTRIDADSANFADFGHVGSETANIRRLSRSLAVLDDPAGQITFPERRPGPCGLSFRHVKHGRVPLRSKQRRPSQQFYFDGVVDTACREQRLDRTREAQR